MKQNEPIDVPRDANEPEFPPDDPLSMARPGGQVIEASSQTPLGGVSVVWLAELPGEGSSPTGQVIELGEAVSDPEGWFAITPFETLPARETLCRLDYNPQLQTHLRAGNQPRSAVTIPFQGQDVTIRIPAEEAPSAGDWQALADYLAANRMYQAWQVAEQVATPQPDSPAARWASGRRAAALASIFRALDVEGAASANGDSGGMRLLEQDHFVDLEALSRGDTEVAFNVFRNYDFFERYGPEIQAQVDLGAVWKPLPGWLPVQKSNLELYRDYLRGVWVTAATAMHRYIPLIAGGSLEDPSASSLEAQIDTRFHQNFRTTDATPQLAHALLIPILRNALTTSADLGGFGHPSVPAQDDRSDADYLDSLIALSGESAHELRNRLRVRFDRPPGEQTSRVALNIEALQGLLSDTWQSPQEPFNTTLRGAETQRPLLFPPHLGRAPFYLQYEEWLERQASFYPENAYEIRRNLPVYPQGFRDYIKSEKGSGRAVFAPDNKYFASNDDWRSSAAWVERLFAIVDTAREALIAADRQNYAIAHEKLAQAQSLVEAAQNARKPAWARDTFVWTSLSGNVNPAAEQRVSNAARQKQRPRNAVALEALEAWFDPPTTPYVPRWENIPSASTNEYFQKALARARTLAVHHLAYLGSVLLPYLRATVYLAQADYPRALGILSKLTGHEVGIAEGHDEAGYHRKGSSTKQEAPLFHQGTSLPYTTEVRISKKTGWHMPGEPSFTLPDFEIRFFRLAQGEAALALADLLYRNDDPSSIRRARELFKGVIFLHGEEPGISPKYSWTPGMVDPFLTGGKLQRNPASESQLARARLGLEQIERGLNVYGYRPDMVPVLRYSTLKQAADMFAASAKSAQADYLQYMTRFEQAQIDAWQAAMLVRTGQAGVTIAGERIEIAKAGVGKAEQQVAQVKAQIAAKRKEIEDANDFFNQAKDFFGGMKDSLAGMVPLAQKVAGDDSPATSVSGEQLAGIMTKSFGGANAAKDAAVSTLGSGMGMAIGFGAFAYAGIMSMKSLEEAGNKRAAELKALENVALPAAEAQVKLAQRDVTIGEMQKEIAQAELEYARALSRFQQERFLSVELWNKLSAFANRAMRRYVDLGARHAWLAERALAYEQNHELRIVKMNYLPANLRGVTGADRLMLDLAELEAARLQGARLRAPVKHTISLARDFPMQFGQLKKTGSCAFQTDEGALRAAYPGMHAFRTRAVTVSVQDADGAPPRGILRNLGVSTLSGEDGQENLLLRYPDALPLSEFRMQDDLFVYGLPGETLLQFEGSGMSTLWEIEFPAAANPRGLRTLTDVLITFDMNASFSYALSLQSPPASQPVSRSVMLAASVWDPSGLASLKSPTGPIAVRFPLDQLTFPLQEQNRVITNLVLLAVGSTTQPHAATITAEATGVQAAFALEDGVAMSNTGSLQGTNPALPLNALAGQPADQRLAVEITRGPAAAEIKRLHDLVLLVEYAAVV